MVAALCLLPLQAVTTAATANAAVKQTQVALTFDDGNADQMTVLPILAAHHMVGTFYIITGSVGAPNYLTQANIATIAAAGNEIGGHTVSHPDLTSVPAAEATRQICNGRATLASWGYQVTDFAYPYADLNASVEAIVKSCGFNSGRGLGDIASAHGCTGCAVAESVPPKDAYDLQAVDELDNTWTLAQMEAVVTAAEAKGGMVPFTIHHLCDGTGCDPLSITPTLFDQFLTWLGTQSSKGVSVKTVHQILGGTVKPIVTAPASTNTVLPNPSLETSTTGDGFPDCYMPAGYGNNTATWAETTDAHTGKVAEQLTVTGYTDGDAKLLPTFDLGSCTPAITAGNVYTASVWYKSTGISQFALYTRTVGGYWSYWTSGPWLAPAATWTQAVFTLPAAPAGAVGVSFGIAMIANGTLETDDYAIAAGTSPAVPATTKVNVIAGSKLAAIAPAVTSAAANKTASGKASAWGKHARPLVPASSPGHVIAPPALDD